MFQARRKEFVLLMLVGLLLLSTTSVVYAPPSKTLTVNITGNGSVTLDPPGGSYPRNTVVTLTADPDDGESFIEWQDDLTGSNNPETITMNTNKTVTAVFTGGSAADLFRVDPYLQNSSGSAVTVMCIALESVSGTVELYNHGGGLIDTVSITTASIPSTTLYRCQARLTGLQQATQYDYRVTLNGASDSDTSTLETFQTLNPSSDDCRFVVFNDFHNNLATHLTLSQYANNFNPSLVFYNGDCWTDPSTGNNAKVVFDTLQGYDSQANHASVSLDFIMGNHEWRGDFSPYMAYLFDSELLDYNDSYYNQRYERAFTHGNVRFICMDTGEDADKRAAEFTPARVRQRTWLEQEIAKPEFQNAQWRVILMHIPLWGTASSHDVFAFFRETVQNASPAFDLMISGHTHSPAHLPPDADHPFHILIGGGPTGNSTTIQVVANASSLTAEVRDLSNQLVELVVLSESASNLGPADGANNVSINADLSWIAGIGATSHDVYFGTASSPPFIWNQAETTYDPGTMAENTTYYWQIDEVNGGTVTGDIWSFTTGSPSSAVGWWKLDETTGITASDSSGSGYNGMLQNGLTFDNDSVTGVYDGALSLDGTDDCISLPALNLNSNTVTITAWVKTNGTPSSWDPIVFSRGGSTAAGLNFGNSTDLRYHWNGGNYGWDSGLNVPNAQWTFVALVVEPTKATIYMDDGTFQSATNTVSHAIEEFNGTTHIGWDSNWSERHLDGAIDDVRIYPAALSSGDIQIIRDDGTGGEPCTPTDMHIEAVVCVEASCGQGNKNGQATVTIYDDCGNPVTDALVDGTFTGDYSETYYDVPTNGSGQAVFTTAGCIKKPAFTFTVTDVTDSLPYDPADDLATECSG
jgi:hypothetical protein